MSTAASPTNDNSSDDSLDGILSDVETLLSEVSNTNKKDAPTTTNDDGWRFIDWNSTSQPESPSFSPNALKVASKSDLLSTSKLPSPVEKVLVKNRVVYLKRDDLLRLPHSNVSGNKARKLYSLNKLSPKDFPSCIVSFGGPQSNAMVALAAIAYSKNNEETSSSRTKRFVYYTKTLPRFLRNQPSGNLFRAQTLGMELVELSHAEYNTLFGGESGGRLEPPASIVPPVPGDSLWVPQGGACGVAEQGARLLAQEIVSFWRQEGRGRPLTVCVPGGTCTTALLLYREIRALQKAQNSNGLLDSQVVVIPCVGDDSYARRQMMALNLETGGSGNEEEIPTVLSPFPGSNTYFGQRGGSTKQGYFNFGEPNAAILETFRMMKEECDVNLDLLYGAPSWTIMLRHWRSSLPRDASTTFDPDNPLAGREIMYVHSGGLEGVASQLTRYRYKGLLDLEDIQYPTKAERAPT